jgi:hypothetical protein
MSPSQCVLSIQMMRDLEVWNTNIQKSNNNRLIHVSVLPFEMTTIEPGDGEIPSRTLSWKPLDFLNHIKLLTMDTDRFPLSLWEVWFCSSLVIPSPSGAFWMFMFIYFKHPTCATWTEHGGKRTRQGVKSGIGRLERMKHGNGIS